MNIEVHAWIRPCVMAVAASSGTCRDRASSSCRRIGGERGPRSDGQKQIAGECGGDPEEKVLEQSSSSLPACLLC